MTQQQEETIIIPVSEFNKNKYDSLMGLTDKDVFTWMHENGYTTRIESITGAILISGKSAYVTIRSRPAAPTDFCADEIISLTKAQLNDDVIREAIHQSIHKREGTKHDAAIRKAERERVQPLIEAAQEFVDRVEKGEVRSRYTYSKLKTILEQLRTEAP